MKTDMQTLVVVVIDRDACRLGSSLSEEAVLTLVAVASEDPTYWDDIAEYWPRYRTPPVPEFLDGLALEEADFATARDALDQHDRWIVIDLVNKRVATGRGIEPIGHDQAFAMVVDESGKQHCPLSIHLPPWWEMLEQTDPELAASFQLVNQNQAGSQAGSSQPRKAPQVNREVLFGQPMLEDLATRILNVLQSEAWTTSGASENERTRYDFTVQVHRDWLMTPREDLNGRMPRQLLHGAVDWIDGLVWAQRLRFEDGGEIVAVPANVTGYDEAPMGREEMVMYFDLCRELIGAGWQWCIENGLGFSERSGTVERQRLVAFLTEVKELWLNSPFEGGSPPRFIIECSRRRVPRGAGVAITGMTERQAEEHAIDCDCPICNMMADGMFGVGFAGIDGHHLELDDEFAFSMHETREAWEEQQREFAEMSARIERDRAEREATGVPEPDEFASAWTGQMSDGPLPGDPQGHMKLAFLLAETVEVLQSAEAASEDIRQLNDRFTAFRQCDRTELASFGRQLGEHLEDLASRYPELVSRVADLQSRIDEQIRAPALDDDIPF